MNHVKEKRYTGIQPQYFPRLHYFARILNTDVFSIRDDCQFVKKHKFPDGSTGKSYQAHTPIKQSHGVQLLTVPTKRERFAPLNKTCVVYENNWRKEHIKTLQIAYSKAPNYGEIIREIEMILNKRYSSLSDLNTAITLWGILRILGQKEITQEQLTIPYVTKSLRNSPFRLREIRKASHSKSYKQFEKMNANEKIASLCKEYACTVDYCGGTAISAYMDHSFFEKNNLSIQVQNWECKSYSQLYNKQQGFIPNLSIIDLVMNVDTETIREVISSNE